ncbi:MAG: PilT/PilU family type 4a pilus ATPase [Acidimicrobiales bacterium]|nr:PilT/PilU family type 4a pilus ATPase [Acidimicrobiales bacterium]
MEKSDLDRLLNILAEAEGSDLHLKVGSEPRIRVNGALRKMEGEQPLRPTDTSAIAEAIMHPDTAIKFHQQHEADFAYGVSGLGRFRVNAFRQRGSVGMVFRRVRHTTTSVEELGLPESISQLADEQRGLILVTGPTGSGKTTTLAAMIDHINKTRECHIITIEDPIEVLHRDELAAINQREVGFDTSSFLNALRAALREDPDVILVGEMRDFETVSTALTAAETGHLVLSTLHTIDATETINRVIDFFPPNQQHQARTTLAGALKGTVCQRLVPTADGKSRVPAIEVMVVNGRIQQCILDPEKTGDIVNIIQEGDYYGMTTFDQSLADLFEDGVIDLRSAMMAATNSHDLRVMLQNRGLLQTTRDG